MSNGTKLQGSKSSKKLKAGYFTYEVLFQKNSDENHGETCTSTKTIWINTRFSKQLQKETLFHEILHVTWEDCPLWDKSYDKQDDNEEEMVRFTPPIVTGKPSIYPYSLS